MRGFGTSITIIVVILGVADFALGAAPVITNLNPNHGPRKGGTVVTITGQNFANATHVTFGGVEAESFQIKSVSEIIATSPPHALGTVRVRVLLR